MGEQKHEFKFKKQYDEKYGKKVEKETNPETKQETEEEKERKKRAYNSARFFLESADENYRGRNGSINDDYYEYLRREYLNLDRSAVGAVLSDHPELKHICDVIANY